MEDGRFIEPAEATSNEGPSLFLAIIDMGAGLSRIK